MTDGWRREGTAFFELFALSGVAIAQPLFDLLSKNAGLFVTFGTSTAQAILLVILILVVVPTVAFVVEFVVGAIDSSARRWVHGLICGVFVGTIALETVKKATSLSSSALIAIAVVLGAAGAALVLFAVVVRQFLHVLAIAPLVFALLFVASSPATDVIFGSTTSSAGGSSAVAHPHRVIEIVMDEFPEESLLDGAGHVDAQLFPNFAKFAEESTWYRNETTVAPFTEHAVPAILTGVLPSRPHALPTIADYPNNLFTLLADTYSMNVHESLTRLCPTNLCSASGLSGGFGSLVSQSARLWQHYASPKRATATFTETTAAKNAVRTEQQFVQSLRASNDRHLDFVHLVLPHATWHLLPTLQDNQNSSYWVYFDWDDPHVAAAGRQQHLLQVQATDTMLGQILDKLKRIGAFDDSMIVVTADHGVAFTAGQPSRAATTQNDAQIMWPPLFIKYPGQATGRVDDRPALSVDILPTIASVIGAKITYPIDGRSLLSAPRAEGPRPLYQWRGALGVAGSPASAPGSHLEFDGGSGFRQVLAGRAAPAGGDPDLRIYRGTGGEYGALLGRSIAPLVRDEPGPETASIARLANLEQVDPAAHNVPWASRVGSVAHISTSVAVAIGLNGKVVAVAHTSNLAAGASVAPFTFLLPPQLVHRSRNTLTVYLVHGPPTAPTLDPIPLAR